MGLLESHLPAHTGAGNCEGDLFQRLGRHLTWTAQSQAGILALWRNDNSCSSHVCTSLATSSASEAETTLTVSAYLCE